MESPVLTAVRQGTAEHGVGQQASWGSACCTVHEAILTVAADRKVGAQLCKSGDPGQLFFLASHSPSDPSNSGSLLSQRKHSLLGLPAASVLPILMEYLQFFPYLIPFNIIHHCDYSVLLEKEKNPSRFPLTFLVAPLGSPPHPLPLTPCSALSSHPVLSSTASRTEMTRTLTSAAGISHLEPEIHTFKHLQDRHLGVSKTSKSVCPKLTS